MVGGTRRPRSRRSRRFAETAPPPYYFGVAFFDTFSWFFACRPRRWRRRMRLLLVVVAPPRGSSVRVDRSPAALGRGLFFRCVPSWFFLPVGSADGVDHSVSCGFLRAFFGNKAVLVRQCSRSLGRNGRGDSYLVAASHGRVRNGQISPAPRTAETAAHTRRKKSARDEGRATQRSNG